MKYRIKETSSGFYPQEKKYFFAMWQNIERPQYYSLTNALTHRISAQVGSYKEAIETIEIRKKYLKDKKFKKIYNL